MKKFRPLTVIMIVVVMIIGLVGVVTIFDIVHFTVYPSVIGIRSVDVSPKVINISGGFASSALWLADYKTQYFNGNLYIRIIGSGINYSNLNGSIRLSIPNTYNGIKAVYLVGGPGSDVMIWPNNKTLRELSNNQVRQINSDLKICPQEVAGFKLSYPKTWGDCRVVGQQIFFRTDYKKYNVDLVADIRKISKETAGQSFMVYDTKQEKIPGALNSTIYNIACGGGVFCSGLNINNEYFYEINWDVVSNQPVPKNLDGVWSPDYSFTSDDIWNILRSIQ